MIQENSIKPHPRKIGWIGAAALGMGGSAPTLFIIGMLFGSGSMSRSAFLLLILGLVLGCAAAAGWIELALLRPDRVGGIGAMCTEAFRSYTPLLSVITGSCYWWGRIAFAGIIALLGASLLHQLGFPGIPTVIASGLILLAAAVNLCGIRWVTRLAVPIACAAAILAFLSAFLPIVTGHLNWHPITTFQLITPFHGWLGNLTSLMTGLFIVGWAAPAFEASAACYIGEMIDPIRSFPRAIWTSIGISAFFCIVLPFVWVGLFGAGALGGDLSHVLGPTFAPLFGPFARAAAIAFLAFCVALGLLQTLAGPARTLSQLAEDGLFPRSIALRMDTTDAPWVAILLGTAAALVFLFLGTPIWLLAGANFTYLLGISLPSVAVWLLRRDQPALARPFCAPRWAINLGLYAALTWIAAIILGFEQFGFSTMVFGIALAFVGPLFYAWRQHSDRRQRGLRGISSSLHTKLTGAMLTVLVFDCIGYFVAVHAIQNGNAPVMLIILLDIFVAVALLTITIGLVLPGMISHAAVEVNNAARRLVSGTLADFTTAMQALGRGDLEAAHSEVTIAPVPVYSNDEVGEMAANFNLLQQEIARAAVGLEGAREGLRTARSELTATKEAAEAASLVKSHFLAKMSHEIRTPMNGILSSAELLLTSDLNERQRRISSIIYRSGNSLLAIINQILDLSKLEAGKLGLEHVNVDLREVIEETIDAFADQAAGKHISLIAKLPPDGPFHIVGDPLRMRQVLGNLVSNAIKFTEKGEVSIEVRFHNETEKAVDVEILVRDTGIGIPEKYKERLFEAFSQADNATTRKYGGTGLGLAIVKQIIDLADGSISVESTLGEGTTFRIFYPRSKAQPGEDAQSSVLPQKRDIPTLEPGLQNGANAHHRILLVEDNAVNQEVTIESAAYLGYRLEVVDSGLAAVTVAQSARYDLILMDCHMPGMDGYEATKIIRQFESEHPEHSRVPIVALSANAMESDREYCLTCGMDDHLGKPFRIQELRAMFERWLPQREPGAQPRGADIDWSAIASITDLQKPGQVNILEKIVGIFTKTTPQLLDNIENAIADANYPAIYECAHSLKSSSANLGATELSGMFQTLEGIANEHNSESARALLGRIYDEFALVCTSLTGYIQKTAENVPVEKQPEIPVEI